MGVDGLGFRSRSWDFELKAAFKRFFLFLFWGGVSQALSKPVIFW